MLPNSLAGTEPVRNNQTSEQYNGLEGITLENEKLLSELENRLRPILRQQPDALPGNIKSPPEEYLVPLADGLRNVGHSARRTNAAIRSILERAEI